MAAIVTEKNTLEKKKQLFLHNIPFKTTKEEIFNLFLAFNPRKAALPHEIKGSAIVWFNNEYDAQIAHQNSQNIRMNGRRIRVEPYTGKKRASRPRRRTHTTATDTTADAADTTAAHTVIDEACELKFVKHVVLDDLTVFGAEVCDLYLTEDVLALLEDGTELGVLARDRVHAVSMVHQAADFKHKTTEEAIRFHHLNACWSGCVWCRGIAERQQRIDENRTGW
ncbi:hypothetical protein BS50DRAFT_582281 [Corynespora cassiicola Philippines]|uniref:RRM domain-containing protein n=1 Tax=Corynespora cassiicola Philippines TaxID=1448308 RepID=A0A2T2PEF5_CORCC|nr:hypothetical protein BS50DRAFT_582281 [Corynespora cassiicola Philippines]